MTALGVALLMIGALIVVVEAHVPTLGILGGPGVVAMVAGTVLAVAGLGGGIAVVVIAAALVACTGVVAVGLSIKKGTAVRRRRIRTGAEGLVGRIGVVRSWNEQNGKVEVDGALWKACADWVAESPVPLHAGDSIVVEGVGGLTLSVRAAEEWERSL